MAAANASHVHRQIARVSRRLFVQSLFDALVWCWAGALLLAASWCLAEAHVLSAPPSWLRWAIAGGLAGMGTVFAVVFTLWRWPTRLDAALSLDQKFGLKERITTSVCLTAAERASSAGIALLADVEARVAKLEVRGANPFALRWTALVVPCCA